MNDPLLDRQLDGASASRVLAAAEMMRYWFGPRVAHQLKYRPYDESTTAVRHHRTTILLVPDGTPAQGRFFLAPYQPGAPRIPVDAHQLRPLLRAI